MLILHGWMGSWRYWYPTIERVAEHFRTYSFDFWGFGDTRQVKSRHESIQSYSDQVIRFLDELGIDRVLLVGHSMGGMVALNRSVCRYGEMPPTIREICGAKPMCWQLTSAACVWFTACIGIVCGLGLWRLVIVALAIALLVLALGGPMERALHRVLRGKPDQDPD